MDKLYYFKNDSIVKESEFSYDKNTMNLYFVETYYTHLSFHCDTVKDTFYVNIDMNNDSSYTYQLCFKDGTILKYSNIDSAFVFHKVLKYADKCCNGVRWKIGSIKSGVK